MKTYIPNYIVSVKHFSANLVPLGELIAKSWSAEMIELLGDPTTKNSQGVRFWPVEHVKTVVESIEFRQAVAVKARKLLQKILGGGAPVHVKMPVNDELVLDGCVALYDLNKHIKAKKFRAAESKKSYELKAFFVQYLYNNGYVENVSYETDTEMFKFSVVIAGKTFVWHQPKNQVNYIPSCPYVTKDHGIVDHPINNEDHKAVMMVFEAAALRLLMKELEA